MPQVLTTLFSSPLLYGIIATVIFVLLFTIELIIFKKIAIFEILGYALLIALSIVLPTKKLVFQILLVVLSWGLAGYTIYEFIVSYLIFISYDKELNNFLKNNEFDFFIQVDKKDKIVNYSNKLLKISHLPPKEVKGMHCWKLLLDYLKVSKINKKPVELTLIGEFINTYKESNSKHIIYQFEFEMPKLDSLASTDDSKDLSTFKYIGLIQPIYFKNKLLGRNIYFYQDRMQVLHDLRSALSTAVMDLTNAQNFIYIMMSLTDYVGLYFDYNTRMYIATEQFMKYTNSHQKEYTFDEFMEMMHPNDVERYIEEASTINSLSVTRIKYRLLINDDYYFVLEDSININKDQDLVSIIRILNKTDEAQPRNVPLTNNEIEEAIDSLNTADINTLMTKTENILNTVVGKEDEEN